jgi:hypothetical protein
MKIDVRTTNFLALPYVGICVYKSERANNEQGFLKFASPEGRIYFHRYLPKYNTVTKLVNIV